jgi:transcription termination factor Rho
MADDQRETTGQPSGGRGFQRSQQDQANQSYRDRETREFEGKGERDRTQGREQRGGQGQGGQNEQGGQSGQGGEGNQGSRFGQGRKDDDLQNEPGRGGNQ